MLEKLTAGLHDYMPIPLRFALGSVFVLHGYALISQGQVEGASLLLTMINLFCGLSIIFGFFARYAAVIMVAVLSFFWIFAEHYGIQSYMDLSLDLFLLIIAATVTLILTGSGKLSLENYFGFK